MGTGEWLGLGVMEILGEGDAVRLGDGCTEELGVVHTSP